MNSIECDTNLYRNGRDFVDENSFTIQTFNGQFIVNSVLLAERSLYFAALFRAQLSECHSRTVAFEIFDGKIISRILNYLYNGSVGNYRHEDLITLSIASDYLLIEDLRDLLYHRIQETITVDNITEYYELRNKYKNSFFRQHFDNIVLENAEQILNQKANVLCEWSVVIVQSFLSSDKLCAKENTVLRFLTEYCSKNSFDIFDYKHVSRPLINNRQHNRGEYKIVPLPNSRKYSSKRIQFSYCVSVSSLKFRILHKDCYLCTIRTDSGETFDSEICDSNEIIFSSKNILFTKAIDMKFHFNAIAQNVQLSELKIFNSYGLSHDQVY